MPTPPHIAIINKIPNWAPSIRKRQKKKIQALMHEHGFDEDFIENIDDAFCQGFDTARSVIIELLRDKYEARQNAPGQNIP